MKKIYSTLSLSFFLLFFFNAQAQLDSIYVDQKVMIKIIKGEKYYGTVVEKNKEFIILKTNDGEFKFLLSQIKYSKEIYYHEKFDYTNLFHTRYFIAPSAIPVKKGKVYYDHFGFVFNAVNYGISKNLSIGGGFELTSLIGQRPSWFLTSKIGIPISGKNHIAAGLVIAREHYERIILSGYLVITHGSSESNISLGITNNNYILSNSDFLRGPILSLSGNQRVSRHISLVTENHFHLDYFNFEEDIHHIYYTGIHGIQLIYSKGTFRFAAVINYLNEYPVLPFIGYTVAF